MHRRDVLLRLSASGVLAGSQFGLPKIAAFGGGLAPFAFLTDQASRPLDASVVVQIVPGTFLPASWHVGLRVRSIRAALGAANAVLLIESLRDLRAAVHVMERVGEVEVIVATLPG